jgi:hypothetical protein
LKDGWGQPALAERPCLYQIKTLEIDMNRHDLKTKLSNTAEKAKDTAASAMDVAVEAGQALKTGIKEQASETLNTVRHAAEDRATTLRDEVVEGGAHLANKLKEQAAVTDGISARVLGDLANGVTTITEGLRGRTIAEVVGTAQSYARRHPGTFAVGAAVAGFALARFLRSSGTRARAEARAAEATDRLYRDATRRTVDTMGASNAGPRA